MKGPEQGRAHIPIQTPIQSSGSSPASSVPDPSVPDHRMHYLKSDVELGVRSIPVPYLFHTRSRPHKVFSTYSLYQRGNQQASVIVPHPPDQVCDPDPPDQTAYVVLISSPFFGRNADDSPPHLMFCGQSLFRYNQNPALSFDGRVFYVARARDTPPYSFWGEDPLFPTLEVGLLDFEVDVVLARLEADVSDQPPSIPTVPNHQVSLQCPTTEYPYTAQPQSISAVLNH